MGAMVRLAEFVVRLALTAAVGAMLIPTGVCLCAHEETAPAEDHQPACPEVRQLDRPGPVAVPTADRTYLGTVIAVETLSPARPPRVVAEAAHDPPRGQPLYVTLQTLLI
jgi:hypothetical protein